MASTRLAEAVGYPGSSVAFAQLLSGMERDGLISREVRGKRTYRITLSAPPPARRTAGPVNTGPVNPGPVNPGPVNPGRVNPGPVKPEEAVPPAVSVAFAGVVDYDDLADQVIIRLLRRIADLNPAELATLERLLAPGRARPEELKIV
jgi:hypothetical protein